MATTSRARPRRDCSTAVTTATRDAPPRDRPQARPGTTAPGFAHRPVGGHGGAESAPRRLGDIAGRECGVVHCTALVHPAVDVRHVDAGVTPAHQVHQQPVLLVHGGGACPQRHLRPGLGVGDRVGYQHVCREQVVEHAPGVGDRQTTSRRVCAGDPAGEGDDAGIVDRHPTPAVRGERGDHAGDVTGEDVGRSRPEPELGSLPPRMGEVLQGDDGLEPPGVALGEDLGVTLERTRVQLSGAGSRRAHSTERPNAVAPRATARSSTSAGSRHKEPAVPGAAARPSTFHRDQLSCGRSPPLNHPSCGVPEVVTPTSTSGSSAGPGRAGSGCERDEDGDRASLRRAGPPSACAPGRPRRCPPRRVRDAPGRAPAVRWRRFPPAVPRPGRRGRPP